MLYIHILIKIWVSASFSEVDQTWVSGIFIFVLTYLAGITGAIMPCSILSEVTATVIGSAVSSLVFVRFDFLETIFLPGCGLSDETLFRIFIVHLLAPSVALLVTSDHLNNLHTTEYSDEDEMETVFLFRHEY
jgi:quinol-cytochrome oxidoreductase complex cytochrome b subunit